MATPAPSYDTFGKLALILGAFFLGLIVMALTLTLPPLLGTDCIIYRVPSNCSWMARFRNPIHAAALTIGALTPAAAILVIGRNSAFRKPPATAAVIGGVACAAYVFATVPAFHQEFFPWA